MKNLSTIKVWKVALGLILPALFLPEPTFSKEQDLRFLERACPPGERVMSQIYNCGYNRLAANVAGQCSQAVLSVWKSTAEGLKAVLLSQQAGAAQDKTYEKASRDYVTANATLEFQIRMLQKYTDHIGNYVATMIDFPEGVDDSTSAECFNSAFHQIQNVVNRMDNEIIQAKHAREEVLRLMAISDSRQGNLQNQTTLAPLHSPGPGNSAPQVVPNKGLRPSDISGTEELKKK